MNLSNEQMQFYVWVFAAVLIVFLSFPLSKRLKKNKERKEKAQRAYDEKKVMYTYLKPGIFDMIPHDDITAAALFHCMRKEDEDFDNYFENMNNSERVIYGVYQVTLALQGSNASLHSFFLSPANKPFIPNIVEIFEEIGSHDIAVLMKAARRFAEIIENNEDDEEDDPEMGDYARYNFSDFTNEFVTLVSTTNLNGKMTDYILAHKEDFYDNDIPDNLEEIEEESEDDSDERTSD